MDIVAYLVEKYGCDLNSKRPVEIPNVGREILGDWFREFGFKVGAEIGTERGIFSKTLLKAHPKLKLYCIDPWQPYDGYIAKINGEQLKMKYYEAQERLKDYNAELIREFSMDAVRKFKNESLDFVYIDGNHDLPWCMDDIIEWEKKVKVGGIVSGHDYVGMKDKRPTRFLVVEALRWYTELKPIPLWFILGRNAKIEGDVRDNSRSWMWVKK